MLPVFQDLGKSWLASALLLIDTFIIQALLISRVFHIVAIFAPVQITLNAGCILHKVLINIIQPREDDVVKVALLFGKRSSLAFYIEPTDEVLSIL